MRRRVRATGPLICLLLAACGGAAATAHSPSGHHARAARHAHATGPTAGSRTSATAGTTTGSTTPAVVHRRPAALALLGSALNLAPTPTVPVMRLGTRPIAWVTRTPSATLLTLDQRFTSLHLHSGTVDAGVSGWHWGAEIAAAERHDVVAAFNGGFKFVTGAGGFVSYGRVGSPLQADGGSIVTYADGRTDIGAWHAGVPAAGQRIVSVRQNLRLLVSGGHPAADAGCASCWGATLGGVADPARSALGITADGRLVWAGGEHLTAAALADALISGGVVRAVELDINPEWVAAYLYRHRRRAGPEPVQVVAGQPGVPGQFLAPYQRDFFVVTARRG